MKPPIQTYNLSEIPQENLFGYKRKYDYHTGVDLFCDENTEVYSMYNGIITNIEEFTGFDDSPWWNDTYAVMIYHPEIRKTFLYGGIISNNNIKIGDIVNEGQIIGNVKQVLKNDKGRPMSMLHIECYDKIQTESTWWYHNQPCPHNLENVIKYL